jgi:hypothetical protein
MPERERLMENQVAIICPSCKTTITNHPLIESAVTGKGQTSEFLVCECGQKLTFWAITAQLRDQQKFGTKVNNWFKARFSGRNKQ